MRFAPTTTQSPDPTANTNAREIIKEHPHNEQQKMCAACVQKYFRLRIRIDTEIKLQICVLR